MHSSFSISLFPPLLIFHDLSSFFFPFPFSNFALLSFFRAAQGLAVKGSSRASGSEERGK